MEYSKIVAITGLPGLFELINSKTEGAIVRSIESKATQFISSRIHQFTQLESIEVYTVRENVNLVDVFTAMDKAAATLPDEKDAAGIKTYFEKAYPDMDFDRVYSSDMKKMLKWFAVLKKNNVEIKLSEPEPEVEVPVEEVKPEKQPKPAASIEEKKVAAKKTKAANEVSDVEATEEKPVAKKKAAAKKAAPAKEEEDLPKKKAAPKKKS